MECPIWRGQSWHLVMGARRAANHLNCTAQPPCPRIPLLNSQQWRGGEALPGRPAVTSTQQMLSKLLLDNREVSSFSFKTHFASRTHQTLPSISTFLTLLRGFLFFVELTLNSPLSGTLRGTKVRQMMSLPARNSGLAGKRDD